MSHVLHINNYKQHLITKGITNPEVQISLTRTAYVSALIRLIQQKCICEADRKDVVYHILSYWNEIFPVNGNMVYLGVKNFYTALYEATATVKGNVFVRVSIEPAALEHPDYNDDQTYDNLVDCLFNEALEQYQMQKGA